MAPFRSGMVAGSGVANPRAARSRAAVRTNSVPLAYRPGKAAASGVANPREAGSRAAGHDENNEGGRNMLTMANQAGVDDDARMFLAGDYFHEEVGSRIREGGSSTASRRDRSISADPTDAELAMRMRLTWVQDKAAMATIHCGYWTELRSPVAAAMLLPLTATRSSWEQVDNQRQRSLGGVMQSGGSSSSSSSELGQVDNRRRPGDHVRNQIWDPL